SLAGITGNVSVNGAGLTMLDVLDTADTTSHNVTLADGSLIGLAPAEIDWTPTATTTGGVISLAVVGSAAGSTYTVASTSNFYGTTWLTTGAGSDTVYVEATSPTTVGNGEFNGALFLNRNGGQDSVFIGNNGSLAGITGAVSVDGGGTSGTPTS